jgi:hypothetical protein
VSVCVCVCVCFAHSRGTIGNAWEQAMLMYDLAGFPYPPNDAIAAIQAAGECVNVVV